MRSRQESVKGSIEPGKLTDLALLDRDVLAVPAEAIGDTGVDLTVLGGEVVFER